MFAAMVPSAGTLLRPAPHPAAAAAVGSWAEHETAPPRPRPPGGHSGTGSRRSVGPGQRTARSCCQGAGGDHHTAAAAGPRRRITRRPRVSSGALTPDWGPPSRPGNWTDWPPPPPGRGGPGPGAAGRCPFGLRLTCALTGGSLLDFELPHPEFWTVTTVLPCPMCEYNCLTIS